MEVKESIKEEVWKGPWRKKVKEKFPFDFFFLFSSFFFFFFVETCSLFHFFLHFFFFLVILLKKIIFFFYFQFKLILKIFLSLSISFLSPSIQTSNSLKSKNFKFPQKIIEQKIGDEEIFIIENERQRENEFYFILSNSTFNEKKKRLDITDFCCCLHSAALILTPSFAFEQLFNFRDPIVFHRSRISTYPIGNTMNPDLLLDDGAQQHLQQPQQQQRLTHEQQIKEIERVRVWNQERGSGKMKRKATRILTVLKSLFFFFFFRSSKKIAIHFHLQFIQTFSIQIQISFKFKKSQLILFSLRHAFFLLLLF